MTVVMRGALGFCGLLYSGLCAGAELEDGVALVQSALHSGLGQPADLVAQAEQVLEVVGPLELRSRPTIKDKESLMTAQALLKNPTLLKLYRKKASKKTVAAGEKAASSSRNSSAAAPIRTKASSITLSKQRGSSMVRGVRGEGTGRAEAVAHRAALAEEAAAQASGSPKASKKRKARSGNCTAEDKVVIEGHGPGSSRDSFPGTAARCGKKAFRLSGVSADDFLECFAAETNGLSRSCGRCFAGAASHGAQNCAMKCMMSWCSRGCLECAQPYRTGPLLQCVGFQTPEAEVC
mmetsp:Transcript_44739/g.139167  ORF Transcript_44739/g.139167 Transcript_44739/m.139167 type:complete len:293 (-) Transcript_44739:45-923(-)